MSDQPDYTETTGKRPTNIYIFGEPVIKTRCHRNALISGILGGIFGGLVSFLFTSNPKKSTRLGVGSFFVISMVYTCFCTYEEIHIRNSINRIKRARKARKEIPSTEVILDDASNNSKSS